MASDVNTTYSSGTSTALDIAMAGETISVAPGGTLDMTLASTTSAAALNISGGGTLDFQGQTAYAGSTTITGPSTTLLVDNTLGTVESFEGGVLGGKGTVGTVTSVGGTIRPGNPSPGILNTGSLSLGSNSTFVADLNGTSPGAGYSQVIAGGAIALGNPTSNPPG